MTSITPLNSADIAPHIPVSTTDTRSTPTGAWRTFRPVYVTRPSPCNLDCPAGTDVRAVLALAADGALEQAWRTIRRTNPLPGVCGRVCYHPCEAGCYRSGVDEAVAIHAVERALADEAAHRNTAPEPTTSAEVRRIGVVGAGPAGLSCAYHLARRGYPVTVFDQQPEAGGMLRYGIPEYRLPRQVLRREIALLERIGITFVLKARVGAVAGMPELSSFAAMFLAIGAQRSRHTRVQGDTLPGVESGLALLRSVNAGHARHLDGAAIIVGGGNTAIDTARVALRLGATPTVVYRRSREDMPAHPDEIAQAEAEGVEFIFHAAPHRFIEYDGRVGAVEVQRMRPGAPDSSGRRSPEAIPGATFSLRASHVFTAIGEEVETEALHAFAVATNGRIKADNWGRTRRPGVFAGGDAATGAGTVVDAIASGRRAADAIASHLAETDLVEAGVAERIPSDSLNLFYLRHAPRERAAESVTTATSFDERISTMTRAQAIAEARRCISCGSCTACDNCYVFCPDVAVVPDREHGTYAVDLNHCKGCGICAAECPRGAITLVPEAQR